MIHFLSDLHLAGDDGLTQRFVEYTRGPARSARAVYLLGDLFNVWLGDDLSLPDHGEAIAALADLTAAGVPVHVMRGNRDFLLGQDFCQATGTHLLADPWLVEIDGESILLTHGDRFCTRDRGYLAYRAVVHNAGVQRAYYALPRRWRAAVADRLRRRSRDSTPQKAHDITDVDAAALNARAREWSATRIIHGHTHRPATHRVGRRGHTLVRHVLEDWRTDTGGGVMTYDRGAVDRLPIAPPA